MLLCFATMTRRDTLVLATVGLAAAAAGATLAPIFMESQAGAAELGSAAYPDPSGTLRRLADWRGKVIVCNFWATWCAPCREEMPLLVTLRERYLAKGAEFVGIGIDQMAKIRQFAADFAITYPLLVAGSDGLDLMRKLRNESGALPYTVLADRKGAIAYRHLGLLKEPDLVREIEAILG